MEPVVAVMRATRKKQLYKQNLSRNRCQSRSRQVTTKNLCPHRCHLRNPHLLAPCSSLEDEDFDIVFCESGEQALEKAEDFQPEVILLDMMMPGMDGSTTLLKLRELPGLETTPVIFLTAKVQPNEINDLIALGAIDVIPKPFDPMTLADQVHEILERDS